MPLRPRLVVLVALLAACRLPASGQATPAAQVAPAPPVATAAPVASAAPVPFIYSARQVFLPVSLGPADDLLFLLDTGASASAIDRATAERLGLQAGPSTSVEGTAGVVQVATCRVPKLVAGGVQAEDLAATMQDLGGILAPPDRHVDGILGSDFLRGLCVRIDFAAATLLLARGPAATALPGLEPAASVPLVLDNGIPRIAGMLDGAVPADFRLDTGASLFETADVYLNITTGDWERLRAHDPSLVAQGSLSARGAGGDLQLLLARIRTLGLGALEIPAPYAIVQPPVGYFARADAVGFVSNNLLEKCSPVTIDYAAGRLELGRPPAR